MNLAELVQACRESEDVEAAAHQLMSSASPALRKQLATKWLTEEAKRLNREEALARERRALRIRLYRNSTEERRDAARRASERGRRVGPTGNRARKRWLAETVEGQAHAAQEEQYRLRELELDREHRAQVEALTDMFVSHLHAEWTEELLNSGFALPDGQMVLWGDATIEQHEMRRSQFVDNAQANIEGAARHQVAIETLRNSGASTLRELALAEAS